MQEIPPVRPRVLIADDHRLVAEGLVRIIESECELVGTVNDGREAVAVAIERNPDVILLDITMPLLNGIEAANQIKRERPRIKIIFVTMQVNRDYIQAAFQAGGSGYVVKHAASAELLKAIRDVTQGRVFISRSIAERYDIPETKNGDNPLKRFNSLTSRQREVLQLVGEGKAAKEIAALLQISIKTVEFHKKQLMSELKLHSTPELVRYAVEHGWVSP